MTVAGRGELERAATALVPFAEGAGDCDGERLAVTAPIRAGTR